MHSLKCILLYIWKSFMLSVCVPSKCYVKFTCIVVTTVILCLRVNKEFDLCITIHVNLLYILLKV